ncbi:MAG: methyltransferase domain-containing protein [Actinomycetota bacterium]|nr:methyltransferase domain-containing protein [Actinomycetota bacterium]MDQ2957890.1 methyltransferase domain-containing protein [Actinomycetota bacterium]
MSKQDFATRGIPRRHAFELLQGYILCSVLASLDDAGVLDKLENDGLQVADVGGNAQLSRDTLYYLVDRGVVYPDGDTYRLTGYGKELFHDRGYIFWIAGGFGLPFLRFGDLVAGTHHYGTDISRDGRVVAVSSANLGYDDLKPYIHELLKEIDYTKVADLGCGNARNLIGIAQAKGAAGIGVDIDAEAIAEANKEIDNEGLTGKIKAVLADASDPAAIPELESVDLLVGFFFMHEVLGQGLDAFIAFLRGLSARMPKGAHILATEVQPPSRDRACPETFTPEFTLIHALMGQGLLDEDGWRDAFDRGGFDIVKTEHPNIPGGLILVARNRRD